MKKCMMVLIAVSLLFSGIAYAGSEPPPQAPTKGMDSLKYQQRNLH